MPSTTTLRRLRALFLVAAFLIAIWTALWLPILVNRTVLVWKQDDYIRGTLVVESTTIETVTHGTGADRIDHRIWWALGTIRVAPPAADGAAPGSSTSDAALFEGERMSLKPLLDEPADTAALAAAVPPGSTYDVWFHPGMPKVLSQDEWLRVVAFDAAFFDDARRMRNGIARVTVLPLGLTALGTAALSVVIRRRARRAGSSGMPRT